MERKIEKYACFGITLKIKYIQGKRDYINLHISHEGIRPDCIKAKQVQLKHET